MGTWYLLGAYSLSIYNECFCDYLLLQERHVKRELKVSVFLRYEISRLQTKYCRESQMKTMITFLNS